MEILIREGKDEDCESIGKFIEVSTTRASQGYMSKNEAVVGALLRVTTFTTTSFSYSKKYLHFECHKFNMMFK